MHESERGLVLRLRSVLAAPRARIFQALTTPADLAAWWGPEGFSTTEMDLDLRVGGRYRFTMRPPEGEPFHLAGEFLEIDAPSRLVYSFRWEEPDPDDRTTTVTLSLRDLGEATEVSLTQGEFATDARLELHRNGWTDSFDKLGRLLQSGS
jgi:uncharacterized protein YndB with AHSA1/START domain